MPCGIVARMKNLTEQERERFESRFQIDGQCWVWNLALDRDGYGSFYFRGASRRAHRVAWYSVNGEIAEGHVINHTCRNRACVNPQHLQCLSVEDHQLKDTNSIPYINSQKTRCPNGHEYDRTVTWAGKTQRICSICDKKRRREQQRKRRIESKSSLRV